MTIATHYASRETVKANDARSSTRSALAVLPGLLFAGSIAAAAFLMRHIPGMGTISPIIDVAYPPHRLKGNPWAVPASGVHRRGIVV